MNFCKDCKHVQRFWLFPWDSILWRCATAPRETNLQTGKTRRQSCQSVNYNGRCPHFERKD